MQRYEARRLDRLEDQAHADGMEQGREYKDPDNPPRPGGPHYDLARYNRHRDAILRRAAPWLFSEAAIRARREAEEEQMWAQAIQAMGGAQA